MSHEIAIKGGAIVDLAARWKPWVTSWPDG
jgi:hypothetical protein